MKNTANKEIKRINRTVPFTFVTDMKNVSEETLRKLFLFSMLIVVFGLFSVILQTIRLLTGRFIYSDFVFLGISIAIGIALLYIPNKFWRFGLLFVIASSVSRHLSAMISQQSLIGAIVLGFLSILFLIPASLYFYKLKGINT